MDAHMLNTIANFIWGIADDCLRDVYVRGKYRDVILPMTVIRRFDAVLEDTKPQVLAMKKTLDSAGITNQWGALCNTAGQAFCNASPFCLRDLTSRPTLQKLKTDFEAYLDGFSPNVQEILDKFKFRNQIDTMIEADILGAVIQKFISKDINLSPKPNGDLPGLDNHAMGTIFEELVRRFNEANNEEAGEHWTPRDVVELMADLVFAPIADQIKDATYSCYDGACGTGGMLTVAQERLNKIAAEDGKKVSIHLFGQELQAETYAIAKADMMLKGDGEEAIHIAYGSTLSSDQHAARSFDFMLANPPYGKSWKTDAERMASGKKKEILDTRFNATTADEEPLPMIPRSSDGQLLFLLNNISKMKQDTPLGSRIVEERFQPVYGRCRQRREQRPPLYDRERPGGGHHRAAGKDVLQHGHWHVHLGAVQPQGRAPQGQDSAHRRDRHQDAPAQEHGRKELRAFPGAASGDRAHLHGV